MEARIQQAIAAEGKSRTCEVAPQPPEGRANWGNSPGKMSDAGRPKKQGRQRSIDAHGLASPGLKLAYAIR